MGNFTATTVISSLVDQMLDYVLNTPEDGLRSALCVQQRLGLIHRNTGVS